jgi:small subunit ribosomal protein S3
MREVMNAGALGIEIVVAGKVPSSRAKSWRFYQGYLKKCGDISLSVRKSDKQARLKTGVVGVKVSIMPPDIKLPDDIKLVDISELEQKESESDKKEEVKEEKPKKRTRKKSISKKATDSKDKPKRGRKKKDESKGT